VDASATLTDAQKARLRSRFGPRVTAVAQDARSQARNRDLAVERLRARIADGLKTRRRRVGTKPHKAAKRRRLESKRKRAEVKRARQRPGPDD
jgi:ribosome-associated protein